MGGRLELPLCSSLCTKSTMNNSLLFVFVGGGMGSLLRYLLGRELNAMPGIKLPLGTLIVNLAGSLLIGILWGISQKTINQNSYLHLLLVTGFCGGFTTFSAFSQESLTLLKEGNWSHAIIYMACTFFAGILLTAAGFKITSNL